MPGAQVEPNPCVTCHATIADERLAAPAKSFESDIHYNRGLGCEACHGGDPGAPGLNAMAPAAGFVGKPDRRDIPAMCGRCHSDASYMRRYSTKMAVDQLAEYKKSVHGLRLAELDDEKVPTCTECHSVHSIRSPSDPRSRVYVKNVPETCSSCHADSAYMASYDIPTDQLEQYRSSVHWQQISAAGDLSAPTCNDCHSNHGPAPAGLSWVGDACGTCHAGMAESYGKSRHAKILTLMGLPGCITCHENHAVKEAADSMLGVEDGAVCARCHVAGAGGGVGAEEMKTAIDSLRRRVKAVSDQLERAASSGVEVSETQLDLEGAGNAIVRARAAVHTFQVDSVVDAVSSGLEIAGRTGIRAQAALRQLSVRRIWLSVLVTVIGIL
ncbi:MAG: cytochrome c3 family protein, partial [Gemmatimonadales bacterium]